MVAAIFKGMQHVCGQAKTLANSRDAAAFWGPTAKLTCFVADRCFGTAFYPVAKEIVGDFQGFDGITYAAVDGVSMLQEGDPLNVVGGLFQLSGATDLKDIVCELTDAPCHERVEDLIALTNTVGDVSKAVWTAGRDQEIANEKIEPELGIPPERARPMQLKHYADYARYTIWSVSAATTLVFVYLAAQENPIAKGAIAFAEEYSFKIITDGARGALGLASFIIGLGLLKAVPEDQNQFDENGKVLPNARYVELDLESINAGELNGIAQDFNQKSTFDQVMAIAKWIVNERGLTRSATKVMRLGLMFVQGTFWAIGTQIEGSRFTVWSKHAANLGKYMKDKQTFCKVISVPGWVGNGFKGLEKEMRLDAKAFVFWMNWGFDGTYNAFAAPLYLAEKAGMTLSDNVNWFLKESTRHWCSLFQGAALAAEFGCNIRVKRHKREADGLQETARTRFAGGLGHIWNGTVWANGNSWRDSIYAIDKIAVMAMTGLTLYRWYCDENGKKIAHFGSIMLAFDATKAGVGLVKKYFEDEDTSGFLATKAVAGEYFNKRGRTRAA